jgi:RNA polymerase sigma-70 factor (ECF subfamily)
MLNAAMDTSPDLFTSLRPRVLGVAYRMLGSMAEAEDVAQDVWLRWNGADRDAIENTEAWLVATTTRIAIDELRMARRKREQYVGIWLPEPVPTDDADTPERLHEAASDLSVAFLAVLERLAPEARAAFLLHDVFDRDYPEIARILDKSEAACRQIVHRARTRLREERPLHVVPHRTHQQLLRSFADALDKADLRSMMALMDSSAQLIGDGGGIVSSFPKPMLGGARIAQLLFAPTLRRRAELRMVPAFFNGRMGLLRYFGDHLESAMSFDTDGERITQILVQRNPEKLARFVAQQPLSLR